MKIALIQQHSKRNKEDNIKKGIKALEEAASKGAQLIAYSELAFDRFYPQYPSSSNILDLAENIPGPTTQLFSDKAKELKVNIVLNLFEREGKETYDSSPVINTKGEILGKTRMIHILEAPKFHEKSYYRPGNLGAGVFDIEMCRVGIAICYDRHFPEYMRALALNGAELVLIPQAGIINEWPDGVYEAELQIASFQNGYFTALINRVGKEDELTFAGESFVTDPNGKVIARAPKGEDYILYADINLELIKKSNARKHFILDRRPEIYDLL